MENVWVPVAPSLGLVQIATLFAIGFKISTAFSAAIVSAAAQFIVGALLVYGRSSDMPPLARNAAIPVIFLTRAEPEHSNLIVAGPRGALVARNPRWDLGRSGCDAKVTSCVAGKTIMSQAVKNDFD